MTGRKRNNYGKKRKWQSLLRCILLYFKKKEKKLEYFLMMTFLLRFITVDSDFSHLSCFIKYFRADAHKQKKQQEQQEQSAVPNDSGKTSSGTALVDQDQRQTLKFGFSRLGASKVSITDKYNVLFYSLDIRCLISFEESKF